MNSVVKSARCSICCWNGGQSWDLAPILARPWVLRGLILLQMLPSHCKTQRNIYFFPVCSVCHPYSTQNQVRRPVLCMGMHAGRFTRLGTLQIPTSPPDARPPRTKSWWLPMVNKGSPLTQTQTPWNLPPVALRLSLGLQQTCLLHDKMVPKRINWSWQQFYSNKKASDMQCKGVAQLVGFTSLPAFQGCTFLLSIRDLVRELTVL